MQQLESLLTQIIDKKKALDALREQSPEMAEALALADLYHGMMNDLRDMCNPRPQVVPLPPYIAGVSWSEPQTTYCRVEDIPANRLQIVK